MKNPTSGHQHNPPWQNKSTSAMAEAITRSASKQTYYTIRWLVDRNLVTDAFRAYAYFRWVDDILDGETCMKSQGIPFIHRQLSLLESCYRNEPVLISNVEEQMLVDLIQIDTEKNSGLQSYLRNMMAVMVFDATRRGRVVSQVELNEYTHHLACAVTEAMHYFIGHDCVSPRDETRYLAVSAAHITHMLRDTYDDLKAGYINIPREVLEENQLTPQHIEHQAYRDWVQDRVQLARDYFRAGRDYFHAVENQRFRLAGFAYISRFEWLLDSIGKENYCLRPDYHERRSLGIGLKMALNTLISVFHFRKNGQSLPLHPPAHQH